MSLFSSAFPGALADATLVFEGVTTLAGSGVLHPLPSGFHAFLSFPVLQCRQFDYMQAYLAYHQSIKVDGDDVACVAWFLYIKSSGKVLKLPACEVTSAKKNGDVTQVKRFVRAFTVRF